jgi:prepilin-type N-terminal cleavage/methylation domain-containing protein
LLPVRSDRKRATDSGFTLLEVMVSLSLMVTVFLMLQIREESINRSIDARNSELARMLARELLTELEFHDLESRGGPFDEYPGFSYSVEVEEVDLVTGEGDPEAEKREQEKQLKRAGGDPESRFDRSDLQTNDDELQELVYPVRKVKLTMRYPNLSEGAKEPYQIDIETILPALPEAIEEHNKKLESPFQNERAK